jgi:hypothetical protein
MNHPEIEIVILSRDRPKFLMQMIDSLLPELLHINKLWISDNSVNNDVRDMIQLKYPELDCVARNNLGSFEHIEKVISEVQLSYCMILHDDDYMLPGFMQKIRAALNGGDNYSAYGFSSSILKKNIINNVKNKFNGNSDYVIEDYKELWLRWLGGFGQSAAPAFPSYLYRTSILKKILVDFSLMKKTRANDLVLLSLILRNGKLRFCNDTIMVYRMHDGNETLGDTRLDWMNLLLNFKRMYNYNKESVEVFLVKHKFLRSKMMPIKNSFSTMVIGLFFIKFFLIHPIIFCRANGRLPIKLPFRFLIALVKYNLGKILHSR